MTTSLDSAKRYAAAGLAVLPLHTAQNGFCDCKERRACTRPGKHPITRGGVRDATTDPATVENWWKRSPRANVGIATGATSDLLVIDVDPRGGGGEALARLEEELGGLPPTVAVETGGGGLHLYFRAPSPPLATSHGRLGPGLDVQSDGAYVVAPPSRHASGRPYRWRGGYDVVEYQPAELPDAWLGRLRALARPGLAEPAREASAHGAPAGGPSAADAIPEGRRNVALTSLAGKLRNAGLSDEAILSALLAENGHRCSPPLDRAEVERVAASVARYPANAAPGEDRAEHVMRLVLDQRFADGERLLHAADGQSWAYDGRKWGVLPARSLERIVLEVIQGLPGRAGHGTAGLLRQTATLLAANQAVADDRLRFLGEPPPVINCANGELWIGEDGAVELRPHSPRSYLRHCLDVDYNPGARCPLYDAAVGEIFAQAPDRDAMVRHWHELVGYVLQPRRCIPLVLVGHGSGANGKTSLVQTLVRLLGPELVAAVRVEDLDRSRFAVGALLGKRLLLDDDVRKGARLPDGELKRLSEAKVVTGELKFGPQLSFTIQTVPVLLCNDAPSLADLSPGMLRRLAVVPFGRTFAPAEQDRSLFPRVWAAEMGGVLNRALAGLERVARRGWRFDEPRSVRLATRRWLAQANPLPAFLEERCAREGSCLVRELYEAYTAWCREGGITMAQQRLSFRRNLENLGFTVRHSNQGAKVSGLRLRA